MQRHHSNSQKRIGSAFLELIVSSVAASFLIVGMGSAVFLTVEAYDASEPVQTDNLATQAALQQLSHDLAEAVKFSEQTATAITFTVPDRTGDGNDDTLRYTWGGEDGDPLQLSLNGDTPVTLLEDVQDLDFAATTRSLSGETLARNTIERTDIPAFRSQSMVRYSNKVSEATIERPPGTQVGDLLVFVIVTAGNVTSAMTPPAGTTNWELDTGPNSDVTVGVWTKITTVSEPTSYFFDWDGNQRTVAWAMRFSHVDLLSPINASNSTSNASTNPESPGVTTTIGNTLILRIIGIEDTVINDDFAAITNGYVLDIGASGSGTQNISAGATITPQPAAGVAADLSFGTTSLLLPVDYVAVTLAIAPE